MNTFNHIITDPAVQVAAVALLTIIFKALWNAARDMARGIEAGGTKPAKRGVASQQSWAKPLSRLLIEVMRVMAERRQRGVASRRRKRK